MNYFRSYNHQQQLGVLSSKLFVFKIFRNLVTFKSIQRPPGWSLIPMVLSFPSSPLPFFPSSCDHVASSPPLEILSDPAIECVVEVIGGVTLAKEIVFQAIKANKHVVTANKALLATYLTEIIDLLRQHPTVRFGYEAAVCGGIPIIHTLQTTYSGDTISEVSLPLSAPLLTQSNRSKES